LYLEPQVLNYFKEKNPGWAFILAQSILVCLYYNLLFIRKRLKNKINLIYLLHQSALGALKAGPARLGPGLFLGGMQHLKNKTKTPAFTKDN